MITAPDLSNVRWFDNPIELQHIDVHLDHLRSSDPVHWNRYLDAWLITRYDDTKILLTDSRLSPAVCKPFFDRFDETTRGTFKELEDFFGCWPLFSEGQYHREAKAGMITLFSAPEIQEQFRTKLTESLEQIDVSRESLDLREDVASPISKSVVSSLLPALNSDYKKISAWSDTFIDFIGDAHPCPQKAVEALKMLHEYKSYISGDLRPKLQLEENKRFYGALLKLSNVQLAAVIAQIITGSIDPITNALVSGIYLLLRHPRENNNAAHSDPPYSTAVEEILRYTTPFRLISRLATSQIELREQRISPGEKVILMINSANRDPLVFPNPDHFDVTRKDNRHLSFGVGTHYCLGASITRSVLRSAFRKLLPSLRNYYLDSDSGQLKYESCFGASRPQKIVLKRSRSYDAII